MKKLKSGSKNITYECQHCGWQSSKWSGKCPNCNTWESLVELKEPKELKIESRIFLDSKNHEDYMGSFMTSNNKDIPKSIKGAIAITNITQESVEKFSSTQSELDIVLGGGIVRGGLYLIGGSPGVGKSTLLLKVAGSLAQGIESSLANKMPVSRPVRKVTRIRDPNLNKENQVSQNLEKEDFKDSKSTPQSSEFIESKNSKSKESLLLESKSQKRVLYISGEESLSQIKNRAKRCDALSENLYLLSEINMHEIREVILSGGFEVCVIDSIQTLYSPDLSAAPGSVSQVREITFELMRIAKSLDIAMFIIGHITKDGQIAGPRVLEHMVDCVLYFEGEKSNELKILRGFKNRFGATSEIGIFEMCESGLVSANEATKKFFNAKKDMPGSSAAAIMEGSRCIVVEIQALVCENQYGIPKRLTNGFDSNRLNMILALLEKRLNIALHRYDVFVNVAGGIKISEPCADLAVIASIISSYKNRSLKASTAFLGEISLIGDIREVGFLEQRLKELENFGFKKAIIPGGSHLLSRGFASYKGEIKCVPVDEVAKIIEWM